MLAKFDGTFTAPSRKVSKKNVEDGGEGDMNYKSDGKEAFYVYMPFDEEIMKEMKEKFPVLSVGGRNGTYYEVTIEKK